MLDSQQSHQCLYCWGLLQLQFVLSINLSKHTEGVTHSHCSSCTHAVPNVISGPKWEPGCLKVTQTGPQWGPYDVFCEIGIEAVCGLLEETTGTSSCFLYNNIFLSKPTFSSQLILHEHCHIQADFEEVYLKWWVWLCCKASGPKPSSPSPLALAPKCVNRPPKMVTSHISQLLLPKPSCLLGSSPQSSAWFQHRSNIRHVNPGMPGCLARLKRWDGMGWKAGYPGCKSLLILDRRILIYTIRDKSIINPVLINYSGNGKELSVQQPGELKTKLTCKRGKEDEPLKILFWRETGI